MDPSSACYEPEPEPPPPSNYTVTVYPRALPMSELAPILEQKNLEWYAANGYAPPPTSGSTSSGEMTTLGSPTCEDPGEDADGDGLTGSGESHPALGANIADFPLIGITYRGALTADVEIRTTSGTTETRTLTETSETSFQRTLTATNSLEITSEYRHRSGNSSDMEGSGDLVKLIKGDLSGLTGKATVKFFSKNEFDFTTTLNSKLKDETIRSTANKVSLAMTGTTNNSWSYEANAGRIRLTYAVENRSTVVRNLEVRNLRFLVLAYDPTTGQEMTFADVHQRDGTPIRIPYAQAYEDSIFITGLNTHDMLRALGAGWTFRVVPAKGYVLLDADTGAHFHDTMNRVMTRTGVLTVYWGGDSVPYKQRVSTKGPPGECATVQTFLNNAFGANITFRRDARGRLVVDSLMGKQARHADREFDLLTETEKNEYGKWVVGMYANPLYQPGVGDEFSIESTRVYPPHDEVYLYFLTRKDFEPQATPWNIDYFDDSVGIIPDASGKCPPGSENVWMYLDNEDSDPASWVSPWVGATSVNTSKDTRFEFCRVDGGKFRRLTESNSHQYQYAVLKLDTNCPVGSVEFSRYFDNEDTQFGTSNWNSSGGSIWPNSVTQNAHFHFCLFRDDEALAYRNYGVRLMPGFPDLGVSYGVFAGPTFDPDYRFKKSEVGTIYTDDEDYRNKNAFYYPPSASSAMVSDIHRIVSAGANTTLRTVKVSDGTSGRNLARDASVTASSTYCSSPGSNHCYSPARVADGSRDVSLGGYYSWTNASTTLPQWVEFDFGGLRPVRRVELYTTSGYPIQDYSIQYWSGSGWVNAAVVTGNTSLKRTHVFGLVSTSRLRVLGQRGPSNQPQYVRLNEVEIYSE